MPTTSTAVIRPLDRERLRQQFAISRPFPFVAIDDFLDPDFALQVANAYPTFDEAARMGRVFTSVNERLKLQVTDSRLFPPPVLRLHEALASPEFLQTVSDITGIDDLLADPALGGGGIHQTGPGGRLDVHVDFNVSETGLHRRLNILLYFNPVWREEWSGQLELWDRDVKVCHHSFAPIHNRCVLFETSESSFHGVRPMTAPPGVVRKSFAAYYYTAEPPPGWDGKSHCTLFRARPHERLKGTVLMPAERAARRVRDGCAWLRRVAKRVLRPGSS